MNPVLIRALVTAVGLLILVFMLIDWNAIAWQGGLQGTNDAQLRGDTVMLTAQVSGYVQDVPVNDDEPVKHGQVVYVIEDDTFKAAVDGAAALVEQGIAAAAVTAAQVALARERVGTAAATAQITQAGLVYAREEQGRWNALAGTEGAYLRQQQLSNSQAATQRDTLASQNRATDAAAQQLRALEDQLRQQLATLESSRHALKLAEISLRWTRVEAPADGVIAQRLARRGQYIAPGTELAAFVPMPDVWAVAWYREEQVATMRLGQAADVHVDAYPDVVFHGVVNSFGPTSQSFTQMLPPDRATGNFTKVVQRVPVKIVFDREQQRDRRLIPGLNVETYVHTDGTPAIPPR